MKEISLRNIKKMCLILTTPYNVVKMSLPLGSFAFVKSLGGGCQLGLSGGEHFSRPGCTGQQQVLLAASLVEPAAV